MTEYERIEQEKNNEPITPHVFRRSNKMRYKIYTVCQRYGHETKQVGYLPGDWVRCAHCESEFRTMSTWSPSWRERDVPVKEE